MDAQYLDKDKLIEIVNKLCAIATHLGGVAERLVNQDSDLLGGSLVSDEGDDPCGMEAILVRNERLRLIEAWNQLEIDQRKQTLQSPVASPNNITNTTHVTNMPTIAATSQVPIDRHTQFEFLRSEYDRMQGHDSSWE